jgi:Neuraminidase (sialidase)
MVYLSGAMFYRRSTDGGETWGQQVELVPDDSMIGQVWNRPLAVSGQKVAFVWGNPGPGGSVQSIKIVRSTDGGETWLEPQVLALNQGTISYSSPMVSMTEDQIAVTINRYVSIYYQYFMTRSFDGGITWDSVRQITFLPESHGGLGDLTVTREFVFLTYERATPPSYREIWFMMSTDSGTTWSNEQALSIIDDYDGWEPNIDADDEGNVYVTWQDVKYGSLGFTGTVLMRKSTDNGQSWGPEIRISELPTAVRSSLAIDRNIIHAAWDDERNGFQDATTEYVGSSDGGLTWCPEVTLGGPLRRALSVAIGATFQRVFALWSSDRSVPDDTAHVYFRAGDIMTTTGRTTAQLPNSLMLVSPYPNPFNGKTTIVFEIPERTLVRLSVLDLLGREVRVLANQVVEAGVHRFIMDAAGLSTGVYYLAFFTQEAKEVRPIVLVK